jgi:microsomal dipeptidase-like Zn-dependent dipeptidase
MSKNREKYKKRLKEKNQNQLFVGGISPNVDKSKPQKIPKIQTKKNFKFLTKFLETLKSYFERYGKLEECRMMRDKLTSKKADKTFQREISRICLCDL